MTAPAITPETFPYRRKWTKAQLAEILDRKDRLVEAMTDAVGPVGQMLMLPLDMLHILALHLSLAGGDVRPELAYIVSRPVQQEENDKKSDSVVVFEGLREWVLKSEYEPAPADPDETTARAQAAADQIRRQLSPEVTAVLTQILSERFAQAEMDALPLQSQVDDGLALEAELRANTQEENNE
ncbi:hypothetical protein EB72_24835 [Mycobacterium sp. SWH-M1]|nr:hypothetical protein EB72_24835 [Mycobacterium sp. SWH-M1]